jgi:RNA polymerase sigma-70 factor (ECF subfamily)
MNVPCGRKVHWWKMANEPPVRENREDEFLRLFARAQRRIHAYILALVFDANSAADLLQEVNIVLWRKFDQYQSGTNFFAWAREIARLSVLRHRQTTAARIVTLDPQVLDELADRFADATPLGDDDRRSDALSACLQKLNEADRDLILARYRPGASVKAIAERTQRTVNSVSQSLSRIRRLLAECVARTLRAEEQPC